MIEDSQILRVLITWKDYFSKKKLIDRSIVDTILHSLNKEIIDIVGIRRSGKSSLLSLIMQKKQIPDSQILFVNFEDPIFVNDLHVELLERIWEIYKININSNNTVYIFFDEIQLIPQWEKWIRKIRDMELAHVFITGSSSKLIGKEFGTTLTGRHISFVLYPLSFKEYLTFNKIEIPENKNTLISNEILLRKNFDLYLLEGGFPEVILSNNSNLLKNYFEDILYRDIVMRYEVRDVNLLRRLANYCLTNIAQPTSINSLKKIFKASHEKITNYLTYLEESMLLFQIPIFSYSLKVQEVNPKKIYCIDNGLRNSVSFKFSADHGKLVENLVFLELKRRGSDIFYWREKNEVDFVIRDNISSLIAMNVTYSDEIQERELNGLMEFKEKFSKKVKKMILLTKNTEKVVNDIQFIPIWKWILLDSIGKE